VSELLARFADLRRDDPARPLVHLPDLGTVLSADAIWNAHLRYADSLTQLGVAPGELVVSAVGNTAGSVALLLACRALGVAVMPVDAGATPTEIRRLAERFEAAVVVTPDFMTVAEWTRRQYPGAAVLKLTSGSTGAPKAALTTEAQLVGDATHIIAAMGIRPSDTQIAAIPVSHSYGLGNLMLPLLLQGTAFVLRGAFVPHQLQADARRYDVRVFPGVPFMFEYFLTNHPPDGWPPSLQLLISAGAPLAPSTTRAFHEQYGVKIHSFYGATETGGITYDESEDPDTGGAIGRAMPGVRITLRPEEQSADISPREQSADVSRGEQSAIGSRQEGGRIHVRSAAVSSGYSDGDRDGFIDGGFLTGDYGALDDCQRLTLLGRVSSFVNVAGRKVQPDEVERVLRAMPGVRDVRVVAAPDTRRGQQIVACVVVNGGNVTALAIRRFCAARLAPYKIPRSVVFLDTIPLTPRGKTDRAALDDLVRARIRA
jgi:acyl-CoA synthetase (AMP-forming)/AMP-acid ligase II